MQILGVHIDYPFLKVALVQKSRRSHEIIFLKTFLWDEIETVKQIYIDSGRRKIISGLPTFDLLVQPMEVATSNQKNLEEQIRFRSEATSHFKLEDMLIVPHILSKGKNTTNLLLFTVPKEAIAKHLEALGQKRIDPDYLSTSPTALVSFFRFKMPLIQDAWIVDLGFSEWSCIHMQEGNLKKCHSIQGGTQSLLSALCLDRKKTLFEKELKSIAQQIDLFQVQEEFNPHLFSSLTAIKQDFARIIYSFYQSSQHVPIFFTGNMDVFGNMTSYLKEGVKDWIAEEVPLEMTKEEQKCAVAIGLAVELSPSSLQLRQGEFFPQKTWEKWGAYGLCAILFSLLLGLGFSFLGKHFANIHQQNMASYLSKELRAADPLLEKKISSTDPEEMIQRFERIALIHSKEYPFSLQVPSVSEVLSWAHQHPLILQTQEEENPIDIQSIHYQLVQYPKLDAQKSPYEGKVTLTFRTNNPLNARKFHDLLLEGDPVVDQTQEIEWEVSDQLYRAQFNLKKKVPLCH